MHVEVAYPEPSFRLYRPNGISRHTATHEAPNTISKNKPGFNRTRPKVESATYRAARM